MNVNKVSDYIEKAKEVLKQKTFSPLMCNIRADQFEEYLYGYYERETRKNGSVIDVLNAKHLCRQLIDAVNYPKSTIIAIMITGGVGTGKTTLLRAFRNMLLHAVNDGMRVPVPSPIINATNLLECARPNNQYATFIDDVGTEPAEMMLYGNARKPFREWCEISYERKFPFVFTTNLNPQSMRERYGDRAFDRLREVCAIVTAKGTSYRGK